MSNPILPAPAPQEQPTAPLAHTPGPWHVSSANPWNVIAPREDEPDRDCLVGTCYIHGRNHRTYEANARLIAAAPELLEALRGALVALQVQPSSTLGFTPAESTIRRDAKRAIRCAIARATGEGC